MIVLKKVNCNLKKNNSIKTLTEFQSNSTVFTIIFLFFLEFRFLQKEISFTLLYITIN